MRAGPWDGVAVTGCGPWPGEDLATELEVVVSDLAAETPDRAGVTGAPFLPVLAARGPAASAVAQAAGLLQDLPVELGPHGWRLADHAGLDAERVAQVARADLETTAVVAHGWTGPLVVPVVGPVTLAANLYLARGDRVVSDAVASDDLAASFAEGLRARLASLVAVLPGATPVVVLHEPLLPAALAGALPTFSGFARLRRVPGPAAAARMRTVLEAVDGAGMPAGAVHLGAGWGALGVVQEAGAGAVGLDVAALTEPGWDAVAAAVESGLRLWAALPDVLRSQCAGPDVVGQAASLTVPWRRTGLSAAALGDVVVLARQAASASPALARRALDDAVRAARVVAEVARS